MADVEKVIKVLVTLKDVHDGMGNPIVANIADEAIQTIRELREDCNRYHEWGFHEGYEKAKEQIPKWHLCSDGDFPKSGTKVLTITDSGDIEVTMVGGCYWVSHLACHFGEDKIIAWMELPSFAEVE